MANDNLASSSSKTAATKESKVAVDDDLERLLNREATALQRELEVTRILKAFKLNPYEILDLEPTVTAEGIKKKYRQLSLFIHPDKTPDPRAPGAFDLLKKAESELTEEKKRDEINAVLREARNQVLKGLSLPTTVAEDDPRLREEGVNMKELLRSKAKELLIDDEVRRRNAIKVQLANEGTEQRMKEAEVSMRKRKAEDDARWEENREARVGSWRTFNGKPKKKKKGENLLG